MYGQWDYDSLVSLTLCMLGNFLIILSCADFYHFFFQKILSGTLKIRVSHGLNPDQVGHSICPDLCLNCVQTV